MSEFTEIMDAMVKAFDPSAAQGVDADVQLHAGGEGGGDYVLAIADGAASVRAGLVDEPAVRLTVSAEDWIAIIKGELDPARAFMTGKLKLSGDMGLLMKFPQMFHA